MNYSSRSESWSQRNNIRRDVDSNPPLHQLLLPSDDFAATASTNEITQANHINTQYVRANKYFVLFLVRQLFVQVFDKQTQM